MSSKKKIADQARRDVTAASSSACEGLIWETIGVDVEHWWPQTFLHHPHDLAEKVSAYILTARHAENGCLELGNEDQPQRVSWRGHRQKVYQLIAWAVAGDVPRRGLVVRHKCDNRLCINPEHLEVGTQSANLRDQRRTKARRTKWPNGG